MNTTKYMYARHMGFTPPLHPSLIQLDDEEDIAQIEEAKIWNKLTFAERVINTFGKDCYCFFQGGFAGLTCMGIAFASTFWAPSISPIAVTAAGIIGGTSCFVTERRKQDMFCEPRKERLKHKISVINHKSLSPLGYIVWSFFNIFPGAQTQHSQLINAEMKFKDLLEQLEGTKI